MLFVFQNMLSVNGRFVSQESCWTFCEAGTERVTSAWQHRRILLAFMLQDHPEYALQYLVAQKPSTLSIDDVKLHIEILVRNR